MADFDLTAEITAVLKEYTGDVMDKVSAAVEDCGKSMTKDIRQASPKRTGAYKKGWRCEIKRNGRGSTTATAKTRQTTSLPTCLNTRTKSEGTRALCSRKSIFSRLRISGRLNSSIGVRRRARRNDKPREGSNQTGQHRHSAGR